MAGSRIQLEGLIKLGPDATSLTDYSVDVASLVLLLARDVVTVPATYGNARESDRLGSRNDTVQLNFMVDENDAAGVWDELYTAFITAAGVCYFSGRWKNSSRVQAGVVTNSTSALTGPAGTFQPGVDVGMSISGTGIPAGAYLTAVASSAAATLSAAATASGTISATIGAARSPGNPEFTGSFSVLSLDIGTPVGEWKMSSKTFPALAIQGPLIV